MKRRLAEALGITLLSLALVGVLELGLRALGRMTDGAWPSTRLVDFERRMDTTFDLYRPHGFLNTAPREGSSAAAFGKEAAFNSLGYRSPERPLSKPPELTRWLVAGGSTTFDLLAENDGASWPWRLERLLSETGGDIEVWNAGFPGWTSYENAASLILRDLDLEPDAVVLFQGINDLQAAAHRPFDRQYEAHAAQARRALGFDLPPLHWSDRSLLLEKLRELLSGPQDPWRRVGPTDLGTRRRSIEPGAERVFERHLRAFIAVARDAGARVVLITQTVRLRREHFEVDRRYLGGWVPGLEPESVPAQLERLNDVTRRVAGDAGPGVHLLDLAREMPWRDEDFGDAMHFSDTGSARFAAELSKRLPVVLDAP